MYLHWQKSYEGLKRKTEGFPQFSQNENIFVKIIELFAHFDINILILRKLGTVFCLFLRIFSCFLSVCVCHQTKIVAYTIYVSHHLLYLLLGCVHYLSRGRTESLDDQGRKSHDPLLMTHAIYHVHSSFYLSIVP